MFCINVALGNISWRLLFRNKETAEAAHGKLLAPVEVVARLEDDFGQTLTIKPESIHAVMFEDMDQTKMAHVEVALHQARTQNLAQKAAQSDPALRAPMMGQGPAVLTPGMGMNGRGF